MPELPERTPPEVRRGYVVELKEPYPEKEGLVERVWKEDLELEKPVTYRGKTLVTSAEAKKPKIIILPLTRETYLNPANWHKPIVYAIRWLLTWAQRIIKMHPREVIFEKT